MAVNFDYDKIINQARQLEDLAGEMQNACVKKTQSACENIAAAWTGDASKAYLEYVRTVQEDIGKKAKYLRDTAEVLRNAARKMKQADEAARQSAQSI